MIFFQVRFWILWSLGLTLVVLTSDAFAQDACASGPGKVKEACQIPEVESIFDAVENRVPRNYQKVLDYLKDCGRAVGTCYKACKNTTVSPTASLASAVKTLESTLGKPPLVQSLFQCREHLKSFSGSLENTCDLRKLKTKLVIEKSALNLRPLVSICGAMGGMKTVAFKGPSNSEGSLAVTSESVSQTSGNFEALPPGDNPADSESASAADSESNFEPVFSEDEKSDKETSQQDPGRSAARGAKTSSSRGRSAYSGPGREGTIEYRPEKNSSGPFGGRAAGSRRQKIPSHGLSPQERMARDMELYSQPRKKSRPLKAKSSKPQIPLRLRSVDLPLKKAPADQSIWEIHHRAFEKEK